MAKLQKRTGNTNGNDNEKRPMDKIHIGFDAKIGNDGYTSIKSIVKSLRNDGYNVNDRTLMCALMGELNPKFENALAVFESTLALAEQFVIDNDESEIVNKIVGE